MIFGVESTDAAGHDGTSTASTLSFDDDDDGDDDDDNDDDDATAALLLTAGV